MEGVKDVKVIGAVTSPFVMRPRISLNLKGVGYEFLEETILNKSELLLKSNPVYKKMPVLIHDGKPICESMIIVQYIDEVWNSSGAPSILPSNPYDRAIARFWAFFVDDKWFPALTNMGKALTGEAKKEAMGEVFSGLQLLEDAFKKSSKGKGFFGGDKISYLDIAFGSYLGWIKASELIYGVKFLDASKTPLLVGWAERFCLHDAVKEVMPPTQVLLEFAQMIQSMWKASSPAK